MELDDGYNDDEDVFDEWGDGVGYWWDYGEEYEGEDILVEVVDVIEDEFDS